MSEGLASADVKDDKASNLTVATAQKHRVDPQVTASAPSAEKRPNQTEDKVHSSDTGGKQPAGPEDAKPRENSDEPTAPKLNRRTIIIAAVAGLLVISGGSIYYLMTKDFQSTDDAQVAGNAVIVAPKVAGQVTQILVADNQRVSAGDIIFKIDSRDFAAARDKAQATLDIARAQLENARVNLDMTRITAPAKLELAKAQKEGAVASKSFAESNLKRQNTLSDLATTVQNKEQASTNDKSAAANVEQSQAQVIISGLVDQLITQAKAQVDQFDAQVKQAAADLQTAELNLTYTDIRASYDGWVTQRNTQVGSYVQAGQAMSSLVSPNVWIVANFKENQLNRMRVGQEVTVKVDAYPNLRLKGHVDTLQMGTGSVFTAFPAQNATGNFVKIVQRVPVKLVIDSGLDPNLPLPLGLSVIPSVHLK